MFELAVSNMAWNIAEEGKILAYLRMHGITNLEVVLPKVNSYHKDRTLLYRRSLEKRGFRIIAAQSLFYNQYVNCFINPKEFTTYLVNLINNDDQMNCPYYILGSPKNRRLNKLDSSIFVSVMRDVCTSIYKGKILLEPVAKYYGCDFVNTVEEAVKVIDSINHPNFGLHADIGNMLLEGEDVIKVFEKYGDIIEHCHLTAKDLECPTSESFDLLKELKYEKIISVEMKETEDCYSNIKKMIKRYKSSYWNFV